MDPFGNRYPWWQTPYNPHVYIPPHYNNPYYQRPAAWHAFDHVQSKTPHLNPALAVDTTNIHYDLRKAAHDGITLSMYQHIALQPAFAQPTHEVRIISRAFPWMAEIRAHTGTVVTCGAIFEGLHNMLQETIMDSEWGIVVHDKIKKEAIEKAAKGRREKDKEARLKRIDWLGEMTTFKGLERDEEFEKKRLLPGTKECKETWVVRFGKQ